MPPIALPLEQKYGKGPPKDAAEVLAFRVAMQDAGLPKPEACYVSAWLGGAPTEKFPGWKFWDWTGRQTVKEACADEGSVSSVDFALGKLAKLDQALADLVRAKAGEHQARQEANEDRNVAEDTARFWDQLDVALSFDVGGFKVTWRHIALGVAGVVVVVGGVRIVRWLAGPAKAAA